MDIKEWPYWLKGGLVAEILFVLFELIIFIVYMNYPGYGSNLMFGATLMFLNPYLAIIWALVFGLIGAGIGAIIGVIAKKKEFLKPLSKFNIKNMKMVFLVIVVIILILIIGNIILSATGMKCNISCKKEGHESGFCRKVATVPKQIEEIENQENAEELPGWKEPCFNFMKSLGSINKCFCRK